MSTPLETRSMPGALWEKVPQEIVAYDRALREWIASHIDPGAFPWLQLRWLSENPKGIALVLTLLFSIFSLILWRSKAREQRLSVFFKVLSVQALVLLVYAGVSDFISWALKRIVGRLKPHVNWWDKNDPSIPALSFPSSHAFNSAFVLLLVYFSLNSEKRTEWRPFLGAAVICTLGLGFSRVLFGQHYPSDVLFGWILGGAFGYGFSAWHAKTQKGAVDFLTRRSTSENHVK